MGGIYTHTGKFIDPLDPDPDLIDVKDIAHALAHQCRYNGHCSGFYSVGQHCVLMAQHAADIGYSADTQLKILLHDSGEAYLGDLVRPLKHTSFGADYVIFEDELLKVIYEKLVGHQPNANQWKIIHELDEILLVTEQRDLMRQADQTPWFDREPLQYEIRCWTPPAARAAFLDEFDFISGKAKLMGAVA